MLTKKQNELLLFLEEKTELSQLKIGKSNPIFSLYMTSLGKYFDAIFFNRY